MENETVNKLVLNIIESASMVQWFAERDNLDSVKRHFQQLEKFTNQLKIEMDSNKCIHDLASCAGIIVCLKCHETLCDY